MCSEGSIFGEAALVSLIVMAVRSLSISFIKCFSDSCTKAVLISQLVPELTNNNLYPDSMSMFRQPPWKITNSDIGFHIQIQNV